MLTQSNIPSTVNVKRKLITFIKLLMLYVSHNTINIDNLLIGISESYTFAGKN